MSIFKSGKTNTTGKQAERLAARYLKKHGLKAIAKNFYCRFGELDLVMLDTNVLVIVEVKFRAQNPTVSGIVSGLESIDYKKIKRIVRATNLFVQSEPSLQDFPIRFDVASVTGSLSKPTIDWHRGAFSVE
ncbi:MAG: YraN family protein [Gammaproteobacteria bacterium]|nr:YraN family protein [Gammaproteobacteria bacterium]